MRQAGTASFDSTDFNRLPPDFELNAPRVDEDESAAAPGCRSVPARPSQQAGHRREVAAAVGDESRHGPPPAADVDGAWTVPELRNQRHHRSMVFGPETISLQTSTVPDHTRRTEAGGYVPSNLESEPRRVLNSDDVEIASHIPVATSSTTEDPTPLSPSTTTSEVITPLKGPKQAQNTAKRCSNLVWIVVVQSVLLLAVLVAVTILALGRSNESKGVEIPPSSPKEPIATSTDATPSLSTLNSTRLRRYLTCGVIGNPGFCQFNGTWSGFEVDLCRAVGAAIFGEDDHVNFTVVSSADRFLALQSGKVDLLAAGVTYTMERDVHELSAKAGFTFSVPYLYSGVSFAGVPQFVDCADKGSTTGNCTGIRICAQNNTTHQAVVSQLFSNTSVISFVPTRAAFYKNFVQGHCNVLAGEQFDLAAINVVQAGYNGSYSISNNLYSKEPIALVTREDDAEWSDFVNWVLLALLTAEKQSITQQTAQETIRSPSRAVDTSQLPSYQAVATVGNYAEMYQRHLESIVPRAPVNQQNNGTTPLIYSFPFGNNAATGPGPVTNGTLEKILQRGYLLCGTAKALFFANFNFWTQEWEGFDIDYCRAVSAAIFNGTGSTVYVPISGDERWVKLANGDIDLFSGDATWNYDRDINEPTAAKTGFSFSQPDFYTGVQFGGIPPYDDCAENVEASSGRCRNLTICVKSGTTTIKVVKSLFTADQINPLPTTELVYACLSNKQGKQGNAIAADGFLTAAVTVKEQGYDGPYQTSSKLFSRENLAIVTRQDDPQWSSFVNWIVMATFYAEEQNITQATNQRMPTTNLFGPEFKLMLQNAILAVGSHREILARNTEGMYNVSAINGLNANPYGPQHFPPSGLFSLY